MIGENNGQPVRLGRQSVPRLEVAGELFTHYQPLIGAAATLVWLNLRFAAALGRPFDPGILKGAGLDDVAIDEALERLEEYELIARDGDGYVVHEPLSREAFAARFGEPEASADAPRRKVKLRPPVVRDEAYGWDRAGLERENGAVARASGNGVLPNGQSPEVVQDEEALAKPVMRSPLSKRRKASRMLRLVEPEEQATHSENPDMQAVLQIYHKRIGMIGPAQYEKLRFWIEEKGLEGAVVALAIEETVRSADVPRIQYLEGILRNWYNDGIRSLADLHEKRRVSRVLSGDEARLRSDRHSDRSLEGTPNASAYQSVSAELVAKWKELYPDEYDG